jgi:hypothetical protein
MEQEQLSKMPVVSKSLREPNRPGPPNFCADLVARVRVAEVVYPLSEESTKFLSRYMDPKPKARTSVNHSCTCCHK